MEEQVKKVVTIKDLMTFLVFKYKGNWDDISEHIKNKVACKDEEILEAVEYVNKHNLKVVTLLDAAYPQILKSRPKPPFALILDGDEKLLFDLDKEDSVGALGKESHVDKVIEAKRLVVLAGNGIVELKTKESHLFISTVIADDMTNNDTARLFVQLSKTIYLDTTKDRKVFLLAATHANAMETQIISTPNNWILDVARNVTTVVDSFANYL